MPTTGNAEMNETTKAFYEECAADRDSCRDVILGFFTGYITSLGYNGHDDQFECISTLGKEKRNLVELIRLKFISDIKENPSLLSERFGGVLLLALSGVAPDCLAMQGNSDAE